MAAKKDVFDVLVAAGNGLARLLGKEPQLMRIPPLEIAPVMPHLSVPSHVFLEATRASAHATIVPASAPIVMGAGVFDNGGFDISSLFSGVFSGFWLLLLVLLALLFVCLVFWAVDKRANRPTPPPYADGSAQTDTPPHCYSNSSAQTTKTVYADRKVGSDKGAPLYQNSSLQTQKATYVDKGSNPETPDSLHDDKGTQTAATVYIDKAAEPEPSSPAIGLEDKGVQSEAADDIEMAEGQDATSPDAISIPDFLRIADTISVAHQRLQQAGEESMTEDDELNDPNWARDDDDWRDADGNLTTTACHKKELIDALHPLLEDVDDRLGKWFWDCSGAIMQHPRYEILFRNKRNTGKGAVTKQNKVLTATLHHMQDYHGVRWQGDHWGIDALNKFVANLKEERKKSMLQGDASANDLEEAEDACSKTQSPAEEETVEEGATIVCKLPGAAEKAVKVPQEKSFFEAKRERAEAKANAEKEAETEQKAEEEKKAEGDKKPKGKKAVGLSESVWAAED